MTTWLEVAGRHTGMSASRGELICTDVVLRARTHTGSRNHFGATVAASAAATNTKIELRREGPRLHAECADCLSVCCPTTMNLRETCISGVGGGKYFALSKLGAAEIERLPFCIRVILESAVRNCDGLSVTEDDVQSLLSWEKSSKLQTEVAFKPSRVLLQDFTGVPAVVDLASMRDAMKELGLDPTRVNPQVRVDLVVDHSVQVDVARRADAQKENERIEFARNSERFAFLKWGAKAFQNMTIVPPGAGIVHQVNLEYLAPLVTIDAHGFLVPDSLVGTDSHTTMINGLGVVGWGVGGIEAEAVMLGQPTSLVMPEVVGVRVSGALDATATATDLVLTVTQLLRSRGVVGKFVEFFGTGIRNLSVADRATIANMAPEYGATMGYFPVDEKTLDYLRQSGRRSEQVDLVERYFRSQMLFRSLEANDPVPAYSGDVLELDLSTVASCVSGPKRPHDKVAVADMKADFRQCLAAPTGFKGFGVAASELDATDTVQVGGTECHLRHGSIVIAAITSCTNTSNPSVMLAAGVLAKRAVEAGLGVSPAVKTSLSPGSGVVLDYLKRADLLKYLEQLGFYVAGFGCMTCIGNSGDLDSKVADAVKGSKLVAAAVLSGNRNFEGRIHPLSQANYLMAPPLVVAYAIAGTVDIDFETEPIGKCNATGKSVYLRDIWPSRDELARLEGDAIRPQMFVDRYREVTRGSEDWQRLQVTESAIYGWERSSTYITEPPFFKNFQREAPPQEAITNAFCLLLLGDSVTTDHISPAGKIAKASPAARYLIAKGVDPKEFNTYGSRRGNDEVMKRGTFANIRLINKMASEHGPIAVHVPSGTEMAVWDVAERYMKEGHALIAVAGSDYGCGSSRDWAAKGTKLQGVRAIIAQSYERIHRGNLVGMGILPLEFAPGESADSWGLRGDERFSIETHQIVTPGARLTVTASSSRTNDKVFEVVARLDTEMEVQCYIHGGILNYVLRELAKKQSS